MSATTPGTGTLHDIKGPLTKFMRMLFPIEFRLDSIAGCGALAPFSYPLTTGEVIRLPERVEDLGTGELAHYYYFVTAAHLAGRHEFGTYELRLGELTGFEGRNETGLEAIDCFAASFDDPVLAGALFRLCEASRIDAELARRYRGLAPWVQAVERKLRETRGTSSLSALLAAAALAPGADGTLLSHPLGAFARNLFMPLRAPQASVVTSARRTAVLYQWVQDLIAAAQSNAANGNGEEDLLTLRNDLAAQAGQDAGGADMASGDGRQGEDGTGAADGNQGRIRTLGRGKAAGNAHGLTAEELRRLLDLGAELSLGEGGESDGYREFITQLDAKQLNELAQLREQLCEVGATANPGRFFTRSGRNDSYYAYDEWDYMLGSYRHNWCRLREIELNGDDGEFFGRTLARYAETLPQVRRHFQRIRPASYRLVRGLEDGEEIDFDRTVESRVAARMGQMPDGRVYRARKKEARDVATLFLLDMSASTDEPIAREVRYSPQDDDQNDWAKTWQGREHRLSRPRRVIDVNKEALVIMAQALEELGDTYAIMGFSGHGRDNVEFYIIKEFNQELTEEVKARVGSVEPKRSTRMGPAIRHVREKFKDVTCRARHMIMLSDGFPQDFDYGQDRRSHAYGIQDTMVALRELEMAGVMPFCITVDKTGHDYLRQMCQESQYLVIEDIGSLPRQLPKIYEQIVRW